MGQLTKGSYVYEVIEGGSAEEKLTAIRITRVDTSELDKAEINGLLQQLGKVFPPELYRVRHSTDPFDEVLYVYINLSREERFRRSGGAVGGRVIVPAWEVEARLKQDP